MTSRQVRTDLSRRRVGVVSALTERVASPDDARLLKALEARGLGAARVAWDDPGVRWDRFSLLVVRSTWNYFTQRERFLRWVERAGKASSLWNRPRTLRWNTEKSYLRDLEEQGVPVVPTVWLTRGSGTDLEHLRSRFPGRRLVVKPAVSADAYHTFLLDPRSPARGRSRLEGYLRTGDMMVQPYLRSVETVGERALVFLDGKFSHAVGKPPVLVRKGARYAAPSVHATPAQVAIGKRALAACPEPTLYGRVDLLRDDDGAWCVGEVELTEPYLYLKTRAGAAEDLAAAIDDRLG